MPKHTNYSWLQALKWDLNINRLSFNEQIHYLNLSVSLDCDIKVYHMFAKSFRGTISDTDQDETSYYFILLAQRKQSFRNLHAINLEKKDKLHSSSLAMLCFPDTISKNISICFTG